MFEKLGDCKIGDSVKIWCIGTGCWDDQIVKIVDNGFSSLVKVQYQSGRFDEFSPSTECKIIYSKYCGDCGNTIRDDGKIFCIEIQSHVDSSDEACEEFSNKEPQYR